MVRRVSDGSTPHTRVRRKSALKLDPGLMIPEGEGEGEADEAADDEMASTQAEMPTCAVPAAVGTERYVAPVKAPARRMSCSIPDNSSQCAGRPTAAWLSRRAVCCRLLLS